MKTRNIVILFIGVILLAFTTCKKDPNPTMERFDLSREDLNVGTTTADIVGTYTYSGTIDGITVCVSENGVHPAEFVADIDGKNFTVQMTGLRPATSYQYYYSVDYGFSKPFVTEPKTFSTLSASPTIRTIDVMRIDSTVVRVNCEAVADGGVEIMERGVCWNTYGNPNLDDEFQAYNTAGLGQYSCRVSGLALSTTYYFRAYAKNATGIGFGEVVEYQTEIEASLPEVSTVEVNEITATTAVCLGNVASDGGLEITECGVCWGQNANPSLTDSHASASEASLGVFQVAMSGLTPNKTYHVRAYATNAKGTAYGDDLSFTTTEGLPVVSTGSVTDITATSAKCSGNVSDQGASAVTERGICWSTSHNPTTSGSHATNGTGTGTFTCQMTGLTPNQTYYVRAYAKNGQGTAYGDEVSFVALEGLPVVTTNTVTDITATTAKCGGNVTDQGASTVTERGICWATTHNPTISNSYANSGTGAGTYTCTMTGLANGTTYYVRAYAKNTQGTTYGEEREFTTTANKPTVTTSDVTSITQTSATGGGNVTADGGATVTERGICWSTSQNPTVNGNHASNGSGTGTFSVNMTSLAPGTTYYVRAYATNSAGTAYGNQKTFTTTAAMPTVTTGQVTNITQTTALGSGNVTSDGGASVTARGVCWSTSHNPTVNGSHASGGTGTGSFTANMTGLTANTTYYVRAYATNSQGTSYGAEVSFTTSQNVSAPTVTTSQVTNIQQTTAVGGGNVTSDGGANVTERGICWSTNHNPTTSGSHANNGTGTGSFTVQMSGLTAGTTYYVRAYAINSQGTSYGSEVSFTTEQTQSYTISVSASPSNGGSASGGGSYQQGQSCTVQATVNSGYTFTNWTEGGTVVSTNINYTFTVIANRTLVANFTANPQNYTISVSANPSNGGTVTGGGTYQQGQSCTVTATAATGYTFLHWTENGNIVSTNTSYSFTVNSNRVLMANFEATPVTPTGAISGLFSVSATQQIWFSQGNLQYQASTGIWKFADYQWERIGEENANISQTYDGWIDLFGWGTSGYNHGANCYQPWSTSTDYNDYLAYGDMQYNLYDQTGKAEWGYNAIINGGNSENSGWRTPTTVEWDYVLNTRNTVSGIRYAKATVNYIKGVVLLPDDWDSSIYMLNNTNIESANYASNTITAEVWTNLFETNGAVFLPTTGLRQESSILHLNNGAYWSSSTYTILACYVMDFTITYLHSQAYGSRHGGVSVRLVKNYQ